MKLTDARPHTEANITHGVYKGAHVIINSHPDGRGNVDITYVTWPQSAKKPSASDCKCHVDYLEAVEVD